MNLKAIILDMDGVLWRGPQWLVTAHSVFARLRAAGLAVALATNNATRPVEHYLEKFAAAGVSLERWQVTNSAEAAAKYLAEHHPDGGEVYVVGEWGLVQTLQACGFIAGSRAPVAVVCGLDTTITYEKLKIATLLVRSGVPFIGTNPDLSFPTPEGEVPGAGALLAALEAASGVSPTIIGKPQPTMYRQLLPHLGAAAHETLIVGDRLETDIAGGQALGCPTACVLTGVSTRQMVADWRPAPDFVFDDLNQLVETLFP